MAFERLHGIAAEIAQHPVELIAVGIIYAYRYQLRDKIYLLYGGGGLFLMGLGIRAMVLA